MIIYLCDYVEKSLMLNFKGSMTPLQAFEIPIKFLPQMAFHIRKLWKF